MRTQRLLLPAIIFLVAIVAGAWFWNSWGPEVGPSPRGTQPGAWQASDRETAAKPQNGSAPIVRASDDDLIEYRITRTEKDFDEACGLATLDFRMRRSIVIPAGDGECVIGWDLSFGEAVLLYSDRRPPLVIGSGRRSLRLQSLPNTVISVEHSGAGGCELITHSVSPADWVFAVAESLKNPQLDSVIVDSSCLVRAVYRDVNKVSDWINGKNGALLAPRYQAVSVHVEMASGRPVASAVVHAIDDRGLVRDRGLTDEYGNALLCVPDGWQRWVADREGMVAGDSHEMHGARIVMGDARCIDIALSVKGEGLVSRGRVSWQGPVERSALVESGHARLRDVAVDSVKLMLADGGSWAETEVPEKVAQYDWEIEATEFLNGVVEGVPAEIGLTFVLLKGAGARAPAVIGPMGVFRFGNVPARTLELSVVVRTHEGFERIVKTVQSHPREYARIVISEAELPSGSLHLDVRAYGGGESQGAWPVWLIDVDGKRRFSGSVVNGVCDIGFVPPGEYMCEVNVAGWRVPYRAQVWVQQLGVSSYYWELPESVVCQMTVEGPAVNDMSCLLAVRPVSQDEWIIIPRDREHARWGLGSLRVGSYDFAWFGNGVSPRATGVVVDARNGGALSLPQERATPVTVKVEGLRWPLGEGTMVLRQAGKTVVHEHRGLDSSKWELSMYPGQFSWELTTEREKAAGVFDVVAEGGEVVVYCR